VATNTDKILPPTVLLESSREIKLEFVALQVGFESSRFQSIFSRLSCKCRIREKKCESPNTGHFQNFRKKMKS